MTSTPLTRGATGALPLLIRASELLHGLAAPQAARLAERIGAALAEIVDLAGDVEAYGSKWERDEMAQIADALRAATAEYNGMS
jgi:hypothetical protein